MLGRRRRYRRLEALEAALAAAPGPRGESRLWRNRHTIAAPLTALTLAGSVRGAVEAARHGVGPWPELAGTTTTQVAVAVAWAGAITVAKGEGRRLRYRVASAAGFAAPCLWAASTLPLAWLPIGVAAAVAARAWRFRIRAVPEPEPEIETPVTIWRDYIGALGAVAAGSWVSDHEPVITPGGDLADRLTVEMPRKGAGWVELAGERVRSAILNAYRARPGSTVTVEIGVHQGQAVVTLYPPSVVGRVIPFPGPSMVGGSCTVGTHFDGSRMRFTAWEPGAGVRHTWLAGVTGSGKSDALHVIVTNYAAAGDMCLHLWDGKGGTSLPHWADWAATIGFGVDEGVDLLQAACDLIDDRTARMRDRTWTDRKGVQRRGVPVVDPSPEWPIHLLVFEEWVELWKADKSALTYMSKIVRLGRAVGVAVVLTTQGATLDDVFGGQGMIRDQFTETMNLVILPVSSSSGSLVVGANRPPVDLSALAGQPPGTAIVLAGPLGSERVMPGRFDYDPEKHETVDACPQVTAPVADLDVFRRRRTAAEAAAAAEADAAVPTVPGEVHGLTNSQSSVLAVLNTGGVHRFGGLITDTGLSTEAVRLALNALIDAGLAVKDGRGQYAAAAAKREEAS